MKKEKVVTNDKNTDEFIDKANGFIGDRIRDMNMKHRYFKLKEKVKNGKKDEKVCMTKKAFKKEHKNLLKVLKKKDPKKLDAEAKEQKEEMKKYGMQESIKTTGLHTVKVKGKAPEDLELRQYRASLANTQSSKNEGTKRKQRAAFMRAFRAGTTTLRKMTDEEYAQGRQENSAANFRFRKMQSRVSDKKNGVKVRKKVQESIKTTGLHTVKLRPAKKRETGNMQHFWNNRPALRDNIVNSEDERTKNKQRARARRADATRFAFQRDWNTNARFRKEQEKAEGMRNARKTKESGGVLRAVKLVIHESNLNCRRS